MGAAVFVSVLNNTMVNVAVPLVREDFGIPGGQAGWIITAYSLVYAGLVVFALGSLVCALAPGLLVLVGGRALQATGAAAIPALAFGSVARMLPSGERGAALGFISSSVGVGAVAGPVLGGLIAGLAGWHSLFYGTFALVLVLFFGGLYVLPDAAPDAQEGRGGSLRRLDLPGACCSPGPRGSPCLRSRRGRSGASIPPCPGAVSCSRPSRRWPSPCTSATPAIRSSRRGCSRAVPSSPRRPWPF
ncbi:MAG: MFS transporter [Actinomycetota bacterium]|nr:MFS transporter [Actinomycetota bacterium]